VLFRSEKDIKNIIYFIFQLNTQLINNTLDLTLFGGEPFLNQKVIRFFNLNLKKIESEFNRRLHFSATTNGTFITNEIINMFKDRKGNLTISLDGPKEINDNNRKFIKGGGSYDTIIKNLKILDDNEILYTLRATISPECKNILQIIHFFESLKKYYIFDFHINSRFGKQTKYTKRIIKSIQSQYDILMKYYLNKILNDEKIYSINLFLSLNRLYTQEGHTRNCHAGITGITINADVTIYSCPNLSNDKKFSIGTIYSGINLENKNLYIPPIVDDIEECKNCWCRYLCAGHCIADKLAGNYSIFDTLKDRCNLTKLRWESYIILYLNIIERKPLFLKGIQDFSYNTPPDKYFS